jgi:hypothetical protein
MRRISFSEPPTQETLQLRLAEQRIEQWHSKKTFSLQLAELRNPHSQSKVDFKSTRALNFPSSVLLGNKYGMASTKSIHKNREEWENHSSQKRDCIHFHLFHIKEKDAHTAP